MVPVITICEYLSPDVDLIIFRSSALFSSDPPSLLHTCNIELQPRAIHAHGIVAPAVMAQGPVVTYIDMTMLAITDAKEWNALSTDMLKFNTGFQSVLSEQCI